MPNFLKLYQAKKGLTADGVIGPRTGAIMMQEFGITNKVQFCHFIGQTRHESNGYTAERENLNYDVRGLLTTFPKYFSVDEAAMFARQPERIANRVYANRMGNGSAASGDGWRYRGWLSLQLTGKTNIEAYCKWAGVSFTEALANPAEHYFKTALWFFNMNCLWPLCVRKDEEAIITVSRKIQTGSVNNNIRLNGVPARIAYTREMFDLMKA